MQRLFLRSFADWLVATNRQLTTSLHKHCIHYFKISQLESLKSWKSLNDEHSKSFFPPIILIVFSQVRKLCCPSVLSNGVCPVSVWMQNKSAQRKPAEQQNKSRGKFSKRTSPPCLINHLSWHAVVFFSFLLLLTTRVWFLFI